MELIALPAFEDNYIWMLTQGPDAVVVDPGDEAPVLKALQERCLKLRGILVTHHHPDHVGGLAGLMPHLEGPVHGPALEQARIAQPYLPVRGGDEVDVLGHCFNVIDLPGHTLGHVAYLQADEASTPLLFCGDTLFSGGCGRLFEGSPAQMHDSLSRLSDLPGGTQVCCTHEYTASNLRFAAAVEPGNAELMAYREWVQSQRAQSLPTLPSTIARERQINPFLRCQQPEVVAQARAQAGAPTDAPVDVFTALRAWKDRFR